jgi:hypothetical protein
MKDFKSLMNETKSVNRWVIVKAVLAGAFFGALLMYCFMLLGLVSK